MNLIAISYKNIGPFEEKKLNIFFHEWKYLIKAPIWSGKSILFFDWPIYALYKFQNRTLLNIKSQEGYIKLVFEQNNDYYLVIRNIKKWKTKDSCSSKLFKLNENIETIISKNQKNIEESNIDIENLIQENNIWIEEIEFKNEVDLQKTLDSFLPPREVLVSTVILLQDSNNIFELMPAERLSILKTIFNLMSIDEWKEIISEKKREIYYKLKTFNDTSIFDQKIKKIINEYFYHYDQLQNNHKEIKNNEELENIRKIKDKISISQFSHENVPFKFIEEISKKLNKERKYYENIIWEIKNRENIAQEIIKKISNIDLEISKKQSRNNIISKEIEKINKENYEKLKEQKNKLFEEIQIISSQINKEFILQKYKEFYEKENIYRLLPETNIVNIINNLIQEGKNLQHSIEMLDTQLEKQKIIYQNELNQKETKIKVENEKLDNTINQIKKIQEKIENIDSLIQKKAIFFCEKIKWDCPFIKEINKSSFNELENQKNIMVEDKNDLINQNKEIEINLKKLKEKDINSKIPQKEIDEEKEKIQIAIKEIRNFLLQIKYKEIIEQTQKINEKRDLIEKIENEINSYEKLIQQRDKLKQEIIENETIISAYNNQIKNLDNEVNENEKIKKQLKINLEKINIEDINKDEKIINSITQNFNDLKSIELDYKQIQNETKQLKEDEKIINNLYNIFSKELLTYILSEYLPILTEIINNFLTQIVQYQINIEVEIKNETPQIKVKIIDEKWEREVKSLSGWQKIILKIVWMLSISSYLQTPMLFLDETINNLDHESIGKVSEVIENFVKQKQLKLYVVTHNEQIQNMNIRDNVIKI